MAAFNVLKTSEDFLGALPKRAREVLERRFGIGRAKERRTLEAIGASYGITRERVRQIEAHGLQKLRQHDFMNEHKEAFQYLKDELQKHGGIAHEEEFLAELSKEPAEQNHLRFLLTLGEDFKRLKEEDDFHPRWISDEKSAEACHKTLNSFHAELEKEEPLLEAEIKARLAAAAFRVAGRELAEPAVSSWLLVSKQLSKNKLGEWGLVSSPHISPRGVRDLAYLVMKRHGSPMHFSEVAEGIKKNLGEKAHVQTVHNELIKDERFVLVGRGLYALREWGYEPGIVRDIIRNILVSQGPLAKEKLIEKVLKERHVKPATIKINLQNKEHFKILEDGRWTVVA